jgi:hypothetical protein
MFCPRSLLLHSPHLAVDGGSTFTLESNLPKASGNSLYALAMYSDLIGVAFDANGENVQIHLLSVITSSSCSILI